MDAGYLRDDRKHDQSAGSIRPCSGEHSSIIRQHIQDFGASQWAGRNRSLVE
jgi:hypothetical protein